MCLFINESLFNFFVNLINYGVLFCKVKGVGVKGLYFFKNVINDVFVIVNELL